ncbi:MAG: GDSL-type esterase/lipase family protein [Vicinamibacterales bacterium]
MRVLFALPHPVLFLVAWLALAPSLSASPAQWREQVAALAAQPAVGPVDIVFVGSSSVRMWKSLASDFPRWRTVNCGFGGSQLADSIFYFDQLITPRAPRVVVLYAGENDLAAGVAPEQLLADFRAFRERLRAARPAARLIYLSSKPSPARAAQLGKLRAANALIAAACGADPLCTFVDVFTPMLDAGQQARPELFGPDRLHMNATGYALWTKTLLPVLEKALVPPSPATAAD